MNKKRFLCIDDSRAIHAFLAQCLGPHAQSIDVALNGQEGLEKYQASPDSYDVILLDWEMPVLDGPSTFTALKAAGVKVPVLMLTSKNDPSDIVRMIEAGVTDYVLKPFTPDIIVEKVALACGEAP